MACFCSVLYFGSSTSVMLYYFNTVDKILKILNLTVLCVGTSRTSELLRQTKAYSGVNCVQRSVSAGQWGYRDNG